MSFTGKFLVVSHENLEPFMKAYGVPDELVQKGKDVESVYEFVEDGDRFQVTHTTGPVVLRMDFTIGEETEMPSITGGTFKTVVSREGNVLTYGVGDLQTVTALEDQDTLVLTMTSGDIVFKRTLKRM